MWGGEGGMWGVGGCVCVCEGVCGEMGRSGVWLINKRSNLWDTLVNIP